MTELRHFLEVIETDGERDYDVQHDANCPYEEQESFLGGIPVRYWRCEVGYYIANGGLDSLAPEPELLEPGRYEIEAWSEYTPSLPTNGGEEWDGGLRLVEDTA